MKMLRQVIMVLVAAAGCAFWGTSPAHAGMDNELSTTDDRGHTLTVQQWDTSLNGVFPLDRNRLTREWYHSGRARYNVSGPDADNFSGILELGYQIGFPWSMGVGINFHYTTPNISLSDSSLSPNNFVPFSSVLTPSLLPGMSFNTDLGNGPGIQSITTYSLDVTGAAGGLLVANAHGTVTGAAGGVLLRPFARLVSTTGDSVTTYGEPWNMN
jgi:hypothetical protein